MVDKRMMRGPKIVVIGGGTGSFTLLSGIKDYVRDVTALVSMADDGGSTGQLRDELGVLPPGDVRQCLVALSESPRVRDLFNYRFEEGSFKGHAFGNIFLTALEKMTGSFADAVEEAGEVLRISGRVEPMTLDPVRMVAEYANGEVTTGQSQVDRADFGEQKRPVIRLEPAAAINPAAHGAIMAADIVVIAPGSLYTSIAPALAVEGAAEALQQTSARLVYVCNLINKPGQTDGFSVADYAAEIERLSGARLDYVIYNDTPPDAELLEKYAHDGEFPVEVDEDELETAPYRAKGLPLVAGAIWQGGSIADPLASARSYIRHDADRVARELMRIYFA